MTATTGILNNTQTQEAMAQVMMNFTLMETLKQLILDNYSNKLILINL